MAGQLIISGGIYKGRRIARPPGEVRPVMSSAREVLFQVLANMTDTRNTARNAHTVCEGKTAVDLFSGSALMALECASRGATQVVAVEYDAQKWDTVCENIARVCGSTTDGNNSCVFLYKDKAERFVIKHRAAYDIIYCDPPFAYRYKRDLLRKIGNSALVYNGTVVIIHAPSKERVDDAYNRLHRTDTRYIGGSALHFFVAL